MIETESFYRAVRCQNPDGSKGAVFSPGPERTYRYELFRIWDRTLPVVVWIMLNPSTADHEDDDRTIKKCVKFARAWGYGGIRVVNLFAYKLTDSRALAKMNPFEIIGPHNDQYVIEACRESPLIIAAWGQVGNLNGRALALRHQLESLGVKLHALKLAKDGYTPYHPLYLRDDSKPFPLTVYPCYV